MRQVRGAAVLCVLLTGIVSGRDRGPQQPPSESQVPSSQSSLVAKAFRENAQAIAEKLLLAAESMPADKYSFRATPTQLSFAEITTRLGTRNDYMCSRIAGVPAQNRAVLSSSAAKDTLVARLRDTIEFCDQSLAHLDDTGLGATIVFDMRPERIGPELRKPRATAMTLATAFWAETYGQLSDYLRLNGRVPPKPCGSGAEEQNCGSGATLCYDPTPPLGGLTFILSDAPYSVRSDGLGPYIWGTTNVIVAAAGRAGVMVLGPPPNTGTTPRSIQIDLSHPVPGDISVALGVIVDRGNLEVAVQWHADPDHRQHSMLDIPVGTKVFAEQTDIQLHIGGVHHSLQMGPQPQGHCYADGTAIHGDGTTRSTIFREDATTWVVDLPAGSIGRLFDDHLSFPNAVNKGLYYVSLHFVLKK
jgi:hypothetical protein